MQNEVTSSSPAGQARTVGRYVLTAIVDGVAENVDEFFRFVGGLVDRYKLQLAHLETFGPLADDDARSRLPILPPFQAPAGSPAAGVLLDLNQNQEPVQLEPEVIRSTSPARSAERGTDSTDQQHAESGPAGGTAVVQSDTDPRNESDQRADGAAEGGSVSDGGAGLRFPVLGAPVQQGAVILDQDASSVAVQPQVSDEGPTCDEVETALEIIERLIRTAPPETHQFIRELFFGAPVPDAAGVPAGADAPVATSDGDWASFLDHVRGYSAPPRGFDSPPPEPAPNLRETDRPR